MNLENYFKQVDTKNKQHSIVLYEIILLLQRLPLTRK